MANASSRSGCLPRVYSKRRRRRSRKPLSKRFFLLVGFLVCIPLFNAFFIEADEKASINFVPDNNDKLTIKKLSEATDKQELNSEKISLELINLMEFPKLGSKEFLKQPPKLLPASTVFKSKPSVTELQPLPELIPASMVINSKVNTPDKSVSTKEIQEIYKDALIRLLTDDLSEQIIVKPTQEL